jgi:hypothetical protein
VGHEAAFNLDADRPERACATHRDADTGCLAGIAIKRSDLDHCAGRLAHGRRPFKLHFGRKQQFHGHIGDGGCHQPWHLQAIACHLAAACSIKLSLNIIGALHRFFTNPPAHVIIGAFPVPVSRHPQRRTNVSVIWFGDGAEFGIDTATAR